MLVAPDPRSLRAPKSFHNRLLDCVRRDEERERERFELSIQQLVVSSSCNSKRRRIIEKILVTLIVGEPGCGKSSQVPQFLLETNMAPILCSQDSDVFFEADEFFEEDSDVFFEADAFFEEDSDVFFEADEFLEEDSEANESEALVVEPEALVVELVSALEAKETMGNVTQGLAIQQFVRKFSLQENAQSVTGTGCVVIDGFYEQRPVLVRRGVQTEQIANEISILCLADGHENILRYHGSEIVGDFFYYALEPWHCSLAELLRFWRNKELDKPHYWSDALEVDSLWTAQADPSSLLIKLIRDIVKGIASLHDKKIIHRDLRPENVMVICDRNTLVAKVDDLGIAVNKKMDTPPLSHHRAGDNGWRAPEQLSNKEETTAVDMFNLGVLIFHILTGGAHPFGAKGAHYHNENITKNKVNLRKVHKYPEALHLIKNLVEQDPESRLNAFEVINHLFFWNLDEKLGFLVEASDRSKSDVIIRLEVENDKENVIGVGNWGLKLDAGHFFHITNRPDKANYDYNSLSDLIRLVRNTRHHFDRVPRRIKNQAFKDGEYKYFASRFPALLMHVYEVIYANCKEDERFQQFFNAKTF